MARLRIGVIGMGMGRARIRAYEAHPGAEVVAVCDMEGGRLNAASEVGPPRLWRYTDADEMFRKARLDAVSVAVPSKYRVPLTIAALTRGLHVLCERPVAMDVRETERMNAAAERARRNLMISFPLRFSEASYALRQQVDSGAVGRIYFARTVWHRRHGLPGFEAGSGRRALSGSGPFGDLGIHCLDLALWLMGFPAPVAVNGSTCNAISRRLARAERKQLDVEDLAYGLVKFANGATLVLEAGWALRQSGTEDVVTALYGDRGGAVHRSLDGGHEFMAEIFTDEGGDLFTKKLEWCTGSAPSSYREFVDSILEHREPLATAEQGLQVMKILEGIYRSAEMGREVRYRT